MYNSRAISLMSILHWALGWSMLLLLPALQSPASAFRVAKSTRRQQQDHPHVLTNVSSEEVESARLDRTKLSSAAVASAVPEREELSAVPDREELSAAAPASVAVVAATGHSSPANRTLGPGSFTSVEAHGWRVIWNATSLHQVQVAVLGAKPVPIWVWMIIVWNFILVLSYVWYQGFQGTVEEDKQLSRSATGRLTSEKSRKGRSKSPGVVRRSHSPTHLQVSRSLSSSKK